MITTKLQFSERFEPLFDEARTYFLKTYGYSSTEDKERSEATARPTSRPGRVVIYEADSDDDQR